MSKQKLSAFTRLKQYLKKKSKGGNPFYQLMDATYKQNIQRQLGFKKLVETRTACPKCGQKKLRLIVYKNDIEKAEYEIQLLCSACNFKSIMRHDGVIAEYADRPT